MLTALTMSPIPGMASGDEMPGTRSGAVGEPEERHAVAIACVEEEVLAHATGQVERLDQRHAKDIGIEVDGLLHVRADQRHVVDAAELELGIGVVWLDHRNAP